MPDTEQHTSSDANARDPNTTNPQMQMPETQIPQNLHIEIPEAQYHKIFIYKCITEIHPIPQNECSDTKMPDTDSSNLFAYIHKVMMTHYINTQIQTVE
jgi:hypothetical protein